MTSIQNNLVNVFRQDITYWDKSNNIKTINDGANDKYFEYDAMNQLTKAVTPGEFLDDQPTEGSVGIAIGDIDGRGELYFGENSTATLELDYNASSIGLKFGGAVARVKKIELVPGAGHINHRIELGKFDIFESNDTSGDNISFTPVSRVNWTYEKNPLNGAITITFHVARPMTYLKLHVWFDDRTRVFETDSTKVTFLNEISQMLRVYQEAGSYIEEYRYDEAGNRTLTTVTLIRSESRASVYYPNSDRLMSNGKYAFDYDAAGNLVKKGNNYTINGNQVTFTTTGTGVEYWEYTYDLLNRLISVTKNGTIVAEYGYDPGGVRVVKKVYQNGVNTDRIHYVFEGTEPIFEKRISDSRVRSYIYALGRYLARVDGVIGDTQAKVYYYHADYAGSIKAVTDQAGRIVYNADYLPFGTQISKSGDFDELRGFTGKEYDPDIGLYYFNARWYDPELGRFISEDPAADPNNCNLYSYCGNNPIMRADPTGKFWLTLLISALAGGISSASNGGNFMEGFILGGLGACMGYGISNVLSGMGSFVAATLGGGLSGGIMGAMQGGDFWSSFGTGLFSAGVTFGLDRLIKTDNIFISKDKVGQALLSGFKMEIRSLITKGRGISFLDFIEGIANDFADLISFEMDEKEINSNSNTRNTEQNSKYIKSDKEWIEDAIEKLANSEWGKTEEGRMIVEKLRQLHKEGKIRFADLRQKKVACHDMITDVIKIEDTEYGRQTLASHLAHEGTHAVQCEQGLGMLWSYELYIEKDAFRNGQLAGAEINKDRWSEKMPTDAEIEELYSLELMRARRLQAFLRTVLQSTGLIRGVF